MLRNAEAYSEPCQTSKIELFPKIVNGWKSVKTVLSFTDALTNMNVSFSE